MTYSHSFIDLFAGIGGFRLAFEKAGYNCIYSCEINEACQKVYYQNFGDLPEKDITKLEVNKIPKHDILTAGFPCQPFSISGKRNGFQDTRGTLFFHICEIISVKKPKVVVLENVKHLLHLNKGKTLDVILYSLEDLGYLVDYKLLNAKDFGLPQNRERIIIIATLNHKFNFNLIKKQKLMVSLEDYLDHQGEFEYLEHDEYTILDNYKKQKSGLIFVGYRNKNIWKTGIRPNTEHLSRVHRQPNRIYSIQGVHPTLPSQETSGRFFIYLPQENAVRKLTINECYRIMGFPDQFKRHSNLGECYKQIGNSVCIPMIHEIAFQIKQQQLLEDIEPSQKRKNYQFLSQPVQLEILGLSLMNHKEKLLQVYHSTDNSNKIIETQRKLPQECLQFIENIATNSTKQKGVYTVLVTLLAHKILEPNQDIRYHQSWMQGGFSGRTVDTQYITPTLKELGLPSMAESGWLTRSLEQPYPYTLDYQGKINNKLVKQSFLQLIDFVEKEPNCAEDILLLLLQQVREVVKVNKIKIMKIDNPEKLEITTLVR
ncbi:MAG: DNA cytosine methyltransferase [Microcystaceae cyanobacterium]